MPLYLRVHNSGRVHVSMKEHPSSVLSQVTAGNRRMNFLIAREVVFDDSEKKFQ